MYERILIPVDGSSCSFQAVDKGLALAAELGAEVTFLHAVEDPLELAAEAAPYAAQLYADLTEQGRAVLADAKKRADATGVRARVRLVEHSRAVHAILAAEEGHDVVVMGTHGRRGFNRWMFGSVAEGVLRRSGIPCLLIRAEEEGAGAGVEVVTQLAAEIVESAVSGNDPEDDDDEARAGAFAFGAPFR